MTFEYKNLQFVTLLFNLLCFTLYNFILEADLLQTVMAAVLASSRGLTVSSSTKGLFLIFTLLSLICLSSALIDKDQLVNCLLRSLHCNFQVDRLCAWPQIKFVMIFFFNNLIFFCAFVALCIILTSAIRISQTVTMSMFTLVFQEKFKDSYQKSHQQLEKLKVSTCFSHT